MPPQDPEIPEPAVPVTPDPNRPAPVEPVAPEVDPGDLAPPLPEEEIES